MFTSKLNSVFTIVSELGLTFYLLCLSVLGVYNVWWDLSGEPKGDHFFDNQFLFIVDIFGIISL